MIYEQIDDFSNRLLLYMQRENYAGYDPFDGLNSEIFSLLKLNKSSVCRLFWTQFHKRSPVNFRSLVKIPKVRNAKGIALIIMGLLERYRSDGNIFYLEEAKDLGDWLLKERCDKSKWKYSCWGYPFDWQSRAFFSPRGTPTIIPTCYVARSLIKLGAVTGEDRFTNAAVEAGIFIATYLSVKKNKDFYFIYIPGDNTFIYNASLWGAVLVAYSGVKLNRSDLLEKANAACISCINKQASDGSWCYGDNSYQQYVDGFHTGYNLEALLEYSEIINNYPYKRNIDLGLRFFKEKLLINHRIPKYYSHKDYPIDTHCAAQAIITLLKIGRTEEDGRLAKQILQWSFDNLLKSNKLNFCYQINKFYTNKINYMRWTQAWMFYAICVFLTYLKNESTTTKN